MKMLPFILLLFPVCLFAQSRYAVVIDEIMSDPSPQIDLPNNEWIELKNVSTVTVNLEGWRIGDNSGQSGPMPSFTLQPDSFIIVCTGNAATALSVFGTAVTVTGFPSLDNNGELLYLKNADGMIIHAVEYSSTWFENEIKKEGGWTLEMADTKKPCNGNNNWKASTDASGGTPGRKNSADAVITDETAPRLKNSFLKDKQTILLVFDKPLDSLSGATKTNYSITGGLSVIEAMTLPPLFNQVQLRVNTALTADIIYTIRVSQVADCKGNNIVIVDSVRTGIPSDAAKSDLIINEILFNPRSNGYDYVEVYNKSNRIFDASRIYIANRNNNGVISSATTLSQAPIYIFPGDYIVATEDVGSLQLNYLVKNPLAVFVVSPMPSFPDDAGNTVLLNSQGGITDEVGYTKDWHFKLIADAEGVSLERVDPGGPSQNSSNWHSAASTVGYGTPGAVNSQFKRTQNSDAVIEVSPPVFSPDNDGHDDIATIEYNINEPGYVANITLFDGVGRPVRVLVNNGTMAIRGYWNWDGLDNKGHKLPVGTYIIYTEMFNLRGKKMRFKNTIVLARKLN